MQPRFLHLEESTCHMRPTVTVALKFLWTAGVQAPILASTQSGDSLLTVDGLQLVPLANLPS